MPTLQEDIISNLTQLQTVTQNLSVSVPTLVDQYAALQSEFNALAGVVDAQIDILTPIVEALTVYFPGLQAALAALIAVRTPAPPVPPPES